MKIAFVLLASLEFLTGAIGLPKLDYNQFANTAKSLEKKLQPNGNRCCSCTDFTKCRIDHSVRAGAGMSDVMGCCPTIVKENSEISSSGCEVQVKIVVNISPSGKESTVQAAMQNCTSEDHKFM